MTQKLYQKSHGVSIFKEFFSASMQEVIKGEWLKQNITIVDKKN